MSERKRVLVVDDQPDERSIQAAILSHLGYEVLEAGDGAAGLEQARLHRPAAVLLDIAMPKMDGFAVSSALRADERTAAVRILLLTASALPDLEARATASGADAVLRKPLAPHAVADAVRSLIGDPSPTRI